MDKCKTLRNQLFAQFFLALNRCLLWTDVAYIRMVHRLDARKVQKKSLVLDSICTSDYPGCQPPLLLCCRSDKTTDPTTTNCRRTNINNRQQSPSCTTAPLTTTKRAPESLASQIVMMHWTSPRAHEGSTNQIRYAFVTLLMMIAVDISRQPT